MKKIIVLVSILFTSSLGQADEFNKRLRKISFLVNGKAPESSDLSKLAKVSEIDQKNKFINLKLDQYLESNDYVQKMTQRVESLFNVFISHEGVITLKEGYGETISSSMNHLIESIFRNNQPWDKLLTEDEYSFFPIARNDDFIDSRGLSDTEFYAYNYGFNRSDVDEIEAYLESNEEAHSDGKTPPKRTTPNRKSEVGKDNLAGVITTNRFYTRYPTTRLNKNRKRAAAIFRVFLCDSMSPALTTSKKENNELLDFALGLNQANSSLDLDDEIRHGSDPQCKDCHEKLDNTAKTMIGSGVVPSRYTNPGALVYYEEDLNSGKMIKKNIPVSGLGELGRVITEQQTYLNCQVSHFWNWFVGENIPLSNQKKRRLAQKFDQMGRRPKQFIKYLLSSKDFISPDLLTVDDIRYSNVKPIFQRCDSCHRSSKSSHAPILSREYPYTGGYSSYLISLIVNSTNLNESFSHSDMPPSDAGWKLDGFERNLLKAWIKYGAKDDSGQIQIDTNLPDFSSISPDLNFISNQNFKFQNTSTRYLNGFELINEIKRIYAGNADSKCNAITIDQRLNFGFRKTLTGLRLFDEPNSSLIKWIRNCSLSGLRVESHLLPQEFTSKFSKNLADMKWRNLDESDKSFVINHTMNLIYGVGVLEFEDFLNIKNNFLKVLDQNDFNLIQTLQLLHMGALTTEEYLTY